MILCERLREVALWRTHFEIPFVVRGCMVDDMEGVDRMC
jgi:hypothetical protein